MRRRKYDSILALINSGFSVEDARILRNASMTLRKWYERECGDGERALVRDEKTGKPYIELAGVSGKSRRYRVPDLEKGAETRIARVMARYPGFQYFLQTDCRGSALYVMRPSDIIPGADLDTYYSRGIVVCK